MADEAKENANGTPAGEVKETDAGSGKSKSNLIKYVIMALGGVLAVMVIAVVAALLLAGDKAAQSTDEAETAQAVSETATEKPAKQDSAGAEGQKSNTVAMLAGDSLGFDLDENDPSVIESIQESLEYLDYEPTQADVSAGGSEGGAGMSEEDSLGAVNWLKDEKAKLAKREKELERREKELQALDKQVSKKLLTLEQAESARITELAKLYDGMDPRSVAKLMLNLDDETVVAILPRMKQKSAAQVLSLFSPERAARLSKKLITIAEN
jgi:flagellar motility protein MotE (MotC chaperone)